MSDDSTNARSSNDNPASPLNPRQRAFVQEYLIDNNATQAAVRAGYSVDCAGPIGSRLLADVNVAPAIAQARAQRLTRVGMTQDQVLQEMSLLSHSRIDHYWVDDVGQIQLAEHAPEGAMAAIQSVKHRTTTRRDADGHPVVTHEVEIRLWDKPTPLKLMGRHAGLFPDRQEHTGKGGGPIETVTRIERIIVDAKA